MTLPEAIQATIADTQRHFENLQDQVFHLQLENKELKRQLSDLGPSSPQVFEAIVNENQRLKAKLAHSQVLQLPGCTDTLADELDAKYHCGNGNAFHDDFSPPRKPTIRKVDTQMVDAQMAEKVAKRKSRPSYRQPETGGNISDNEPLANNKFEYLKMPRFNDEDLDKGEEGPLPTKINMAVAGRLCLSDRKHGGGCRGCLKAFVNGMFFKTLTLLAIAANTLYLGSAADFNVRNSYKRIQGRPQETASVIPDIAFAGWFAFELAVKFLAEGKNFICGEDQAWNLFDMALVTESIAGLFLAGEGSKLSFLRIFRVFRLVRVVRVVRTVKALARLRTMIFAILNSFVDLLWAFVVILLIVFVFAIIFDNAVASYFDEINVSDEYQVMEAEEMCILFGDLIETMISLWSAVSGGNDWMTYGHPLRRVPMGEFYFAMFNFYVAFCVVGLFNVVTGVFVDSAVCVRTEDEVVQGYLEDLRNTTHSIKNFFMEADVDGSGTLNWEEFQNHMKNPVVKAYFAGLEIDPEEASIIFTILDGDKSKEILIDEFVNGTMKLKGSATKLDLMALMYDLTKQNMKFDALSEFIETELVDIKRRLQAQPRPGTATQHSNAQGHGQHRPGTAPKDPKAASGKDLPRAVAVARRL
eukprot:gb/GFBE01078396.1/.p1 GENE.gb/GFBE01078396.1/~~gb/GFBE01078396.1/.p1  ORF type:complete len:641 (+),score=150.38 gb/GFBE01078396.1/:1-1923(+)